MWDKIKQVSSDIWLVIVLVVSTVAGFLYLLSTNRGKEINALRTKVDLADTQKKADLVEAEIKERMDNKDNLAAENKELQKNLDALEERRKQIADQSKDQDAEEFWKKN